MDLVWNSKGIPIMPKVKNFIVLTGNDLLQALSETRVGVKCFRPHTPNRVISPIDAIRLVQSGMFQGKVRKDKKRVHSIREVDPRLILDDPSRWDNHAVIRFHANQLTEAPKRKNKRIRALWDRFLKMDPPPRNWTPISPVNKNGLPTVGT